MLDIKRYLVPKVRARFGDRPIELATGTGYEMIFPCIHPGFGDITVSDEGHELTVQFGRFLHHHFYEQPDVEYESADDCSEKIAEEAVEYLAAVFADEIEFWGGSASRPRGWGKPRGRISRAFFGPTWVWSGPLDEWFPPLRSDREPGGPGEPSSGDDGNV